MIYYAIRTKYSSGVKGSRCMAREADGRSVYIPWGYEVNCDKNHQNAVRKLCEKLGLYGKLASGSFKGEFVHVFVERYYQSKCIEFVN